MAKKRCLIRGLTINEQGSSGVCMRAISIGVAIGAACLLLQRLRRVRRRAVDTLSDLTSFELAEVLLQGELTVLLGRFSWQPPSERALVKLSSKAGSISDGLLPNIQTVLSSYSGAEYAYYDASAGLIGLIASPRLRPAFAVEVIAPASDKQIARARPQPGVFVVETAALYRDVVEPFISGMDPAATAWIGNVLDLTKEKERVLYNDTTPATGFLLNVDTKWKSHPTCVEDAEARRAWKNHESVADLYCLAICHRPDIRSLRDLDASHLPLLRNILTQGTRTLADVYGVQPHQLCVQTCMHPCT